MQQINTRKPAPKKPQTRRARDARGDSLQRRLHAAGMDRNDDTAENIHAFRYALARRIHMMIDDWHGCPQRLCRRNRGCMAPDNRCANQSSSPPASREETARLMAQVHRAMQAAMEKQSED
jgi:hypothetical protein